MKHTNCTDADACVFCESMDERNVNPDVMWYVIGSGERKPRDQDGPNDSSPGHGRTPDLLMAYSRSSCIRRRGSSFYSPPPMNKGGIHL